VTHKTLQPDLAPASPAFSCVIRKAHFDDLRVMARLVGELFAVETEYAADFESQYGALKLLFQERHSDLFVAKHRNGIIGMATLQRVVSTAEGGYAGLVEDVVVSAEYRGMGVGSLLIEAVAALASERGYLRLQLAADTANTPALAFYEARGFRPTRMNLYYRNLPLGQ